MRGSAGRIEGVRCGGGVQRFAPPPAGRGRLGGGKAFRPPLVKIPPIQRKWINARRLRNDSTEAERRLWYFLRRRHLAGHKFRRQYPLGDYIVDFVCMPLRLVIELDGGQHLDAQVYDQRRTEFLQRNGYRVMRFWNDDVLLRTDDVVGEIFRVVEERARATPPQPSPASQGRE